MERLLLIFIVLGNVLPFLHALPHQEVNLEKLDKSEKNYNEIIYSDDELGSLVEEVSKKTGRAIHQTAWSKENNDNESYSIVKEAVQTNSTKNGNSWDLSQLLKLLLNLVPNSKEDKTEEIVQKGKDSGGSKIKSQNSKKLHKPIAVTSKSKNNVQKKQSKIQIKNNLKAKDRKADKYTQSRLHDTYSSLKFNNEELSKIETEELNLQKSKINQSIDEDDYYDDDDDEDYYDESCDSYYSTFSSEKDSASNTTLNDVTEDSYEAGGIEISDEDYLKLVSETTEEETSEIPTEYDSISSINRNETLTQDEIINQETKESYVATISSNKVRTNNQNTKKVKHYPIHNITSIQIQSEDNLQYDNTELDIISSSKSNEIDIFEIENVSPEQNLTVTTEDDTIVLEKPDLQTNNTYVTSSYKSLESTKLQEVADQPLISYEKHLQSTTPLIPEDVDFSTKNTEFQQQIDTIKQKSSSNTESTQGDSVFKKSSIDETYLITETSDTSQTRKPEKTNLTFQAENYSINNQETTQELLQSLPLSSSGEYISNTSEKDKRISITSEMDVQHSNTSEADQQLLIASETDKQVSITSDNVRQISNISENKKHTTNTSEKNQQLSNTSEVDQQLLIASETDKQVSDTSDNVRQISNVSENKKLITNTSEKNQQLSNTSESDIQLSNISETSQQLSNISGNEQQLSNISENDKVVISETDSKNTILEFSELQKDVIENGQEKTQSESSNLSYTLTKEQKEISTPLLNVIVIENEKTQFSTDDGTKDLASEKTSQITNKSAYRYDGSQKNDSGFSSSQATIILDNEAYENVNINQNGDSLFVNEVSDLVSDLPLTHGEISKSKEENENDEDYYEFDVEISSVNSLSKNGQKSLESVKTSAKNKESDQNNANLSSETEKPYDTILQFLYNHSNSSLIKSLKEY